LPKAQLINFFKNRKQKTENRKQKTENHKRESMAGSHPEPTEPRIIKKKKISQGGHGGAWKVAYADFVTAMMALFIVLWIMSQSQSIRQNVAQYFKNPGLLPGAMGLLETSDVGGQMPTPGHSQELQTPSPITPDLSTERGALEEVKKRITEIIAQLPELSRLKDQVALEITDEGLRIELLDLDNSHFFDLGSANLKAETQKLLKLVAQELGKVPNRITVEGHTDSLPYGSKNYTNWELSADRANAARRLLESTGTGVGQITSVRGYADRQLRYPNEPNNVQNRRVSIIVMFPEKTRQGSLDAPNIMNNIQKSADTPKPVDTPKSVDTPKTADTPKPPEPSGSPAPKENGAPELKPMPGKNSAAPPRLEDQVSEDVRQVFQQKAAGDPAGGKGAPLPQEPRQRLGW
jgi:chemotaxis protein MotB